MKLSNVSRLTLGTAQLGMDYGIANTSGKPGAEEAIQILEISLKNGITSFDTAYQYGDSEQVIGSYISQHPVGDLVPLVFSKLPAIEMDKGAGYDDIYEKVRKYVIVSLSRLGLNKIPVYFMHSAKDMYSYEGMVLKSLQAIKEEGLIDAMGVSAYYPDEAELALGIDEIGTIQVPINLFDHRFLKNRLLERLYEKNKNIFVRSIFLQGLFFMDPERLPKNMKAVSGYLVKLKKFAEEEKIKVDNLAMGFVKSFPEVTSMVVGAESQEQVLRNVELLKSPDIDRDLRDRILKEFADIPRNIVIPAFWEAKE